MPFLTMKVLLINTSERTGGAAIACNRLMAALNHSGIEAKMLVRDKETDNASVTGIENGMMQKLRFVWERGIIFLNNRLSKENIFQVDIANTGCDITDLDVFKEADVIHLHWTNQGFLSLGDMEKILRSGKKIVITMHDQWYFTGICHYSGECKRYQAFCTNCPQIKGRIRDLAKSVFMKKQKMYSSAKITFVGCSKWIADMARLSSLTKGHEVVSIPNAIDTDVFCQKEWKSCRKEFGLPEDRKLLLFGAQKITDERKGFKFLVEACNIIKEQFPGVAHELGIVVVGGKSEAISNALPLPVYTVPYISEQGKMVALYNAVDAYVTPSLQDNLPNTIVEAMSCGIPCVGFRVGGIPEMINHKENGYVAEYRDAGDLAEGIMWTVAAENYSDLCENARNKALETYSEKSVAEKYLKIYDHNSNRNI